MVKAAAGWLVRFAKDRGPDVAKWIWENRKEALGIGGAMVAAWRWAATRRDKDSATLDLLRQQVTYLTESADDDNEAVAARGLRREVERLGRALDLARGAPNKHTRRSEVAKVRERIEAIRVRINDAYVEEQIEDRGGPASRWAIDYDSDLREP